MHQESGLRAFPVPRSQSPTPLTDPGPRIPRSQSLDTQIPPSRISLIPVPRYPDPTPDPNPRIQIPRMPRSLSDQIRIADIRSQILLPQKYPARGGPAAGGVALKIRRAAFHAVPAAFEIMLPPTLRRRSANIQAELVFSIGSEASYTHASEAHSRN